MPLTNGRNRSSEHLDGLNGRDNLAVVLDAWSRRAVGWAMATHLKTELVLDALNMAVTQRRPTNVIHHSDQGCAIHVARLRAPLSGRRRAAVDGVRRRRLR